MASFVSLCRAHLPSLGCLDIQTFLVLVLLWLTRVSTRQTVLTFYGINKVTTKEIFFKRSSLQMSDRALSMAGRVKCLSPSDRV